MRRAIAIAAATLTTVALAGCGDDGRNTATDRSAASPTTAGESSASSTSAPVLTNEGLALLSREYDLISYVDFETPEKLAEQADVVLTGTVAAVLPGPSVTTAGSEDGSTTRDNTVILQVKVDEQIKPGPEGVISDGMAYVSIPRGVSSTDANGKVLGADLTPKVEDFQRVLPAGLRLVIASWVADSAVDNPKVQKVEEAPRSVPEGVALLEGTHPQTITFDQGTKDLAAWGDVSFDRLIARVVP